ncbi:MAG TPA: IPT/TIG domain-containing protein [Candidatus Bathyarchaeia archaeon]|nr:IPT/TIG domain-containing protein [Candidatus Bathyarchaeia archaeon]
MSGGSITATLSNSPGGSTDWLGLSAVASADTSFLQHTDVGAGITSRTWTVTMPAAPGSYEFRLYLNNMYTVAARSAAVTVVNPTPKITSLSPSSVAVGSAAFTLTVSGSGFASGATATVGGQVRAVTVVSATQVRIAVLAGDVASVGNVQVQVTNPGGCVSGGCASNTVNLGVVRNRWRFH